MDIYTIEALVLEALETNPATRNSDSLLYLVICKKLNPNAGNIKLEQFLLNRKEYGLPNYESVGRARRKMQASFKNLRASDDVLDGRYAKYKEFRDYAIS